MDLASLFPSQVPCMKQRTTVGLLSSPPFAEVGSSRCKRSPLPAAPVTFTRFTSHVVHTLCRERLHQRPTKAQAQGGTWENQHSGL